MRICASPGSSGRIRKARARHAPTAKIFASPQKGLALSREESVAVLARAVEPRRELKGEEALQPRCREANGGVAVVAADAAMNRNGGHHAEVEHP